MTEKLSIELGNGKEALENLRKIKKESLVAGKVLDALLPKSVPLGVRPQPDGRPKKFPRPLPPVLSDRLPLPEHRYNELMAKSRQIGGSKTGQVLNLATDIAKMSLAGTFLPGKVDAAGKLVGGQLDKRPWRRFERNLRAHEAFRSTRFHHSINAGADVVRNMGSMDTDTLWEKFHDRSVASEAIRKEIGATEETVKLYQDQWANATPNSTWPQLHANKPLFETMQAEKRRILALENARHWNEVLKGHMGDRLMLDAKLSGENVWTNDFLDDKWMARKFEWAASLANKGSGPSSITSPRTAPMLGRIPPVGGASTVDPMLGRVPPSGDLSGGFGSDSLMGGAGVDRLTESLTRLDSGFRKVSDGGTVLGQTFGTLGTQVSAGARAHDQFAQSLTRGLEVGPAVSEMFSGVTQSVQDAGTGLASLAEGLGTSGGALTLWGEQANGAALMAGAGVDGATARLDGGAMMIENLMTGRLPTAANIFGTLMNQGALSASDGFRMFGEVASTSSSRVGQIAGQAFQGVGQALGGIVTGSMSAKEAFSGLAKSVLEDIADMAMSSGSLGGFGDILGKGMDFLGIGFGDILSWLPFKHGGVFDHGRLKRFARGTLDFRPRAFILQA